jgi:hypothetical protein
VLPRRRQIIAAPLSVKDSGLCSGPLRNPVGRVDATGLLQLLAQRAR